MTPISPLNGLSYLAEAAPSGPASLFTNPLVFPVIMFVMIYFLIIRPQQRQRKEQATRVAALASGDRVITSAGIHGIVHNVKEKTVVIKVAEGTMIEFDKPAVATVVKKDAEVK